MSSAKRALEQRSLKNAAVGSQDELPFFSTLDDQRLATVLARGGLLASQQALGRHPSNAGLLTIRASNVPAHAGPDPHRLVAILAGRETTRSWLQVGHIVTMRLVRPVSGGTPTLSGVEQFGQRMRLVSMELAIPSSYRGSNVDRFAMIAALPHSQVDRILCGYEPSFPRASRRA